MRQLAIPLNRFPLTGLGCWLGLILTLAFCRLAAGEPSLAQQYKVLLKQFGDANRAFSKAHSAAKTEEERQQARKLAPSRRATAQRLLALAEKHPKSATALDSLVWILSEAPDSEEAVQAGDQLLRDQLDNPKLWEACNNLTYALPSRTDESSRVLRAVTKSNSRRKSQGWAAYCLGKRLIQPWWRIENPTDRDRTPEAEELFNLVARGFADVEGWPGRTLGDMAKGELFELYHLAIGKVAPEIEGEDVDGKQFKLSDYRGKVVVIDFWGDW